MSRLKAAYPWINLPFVVSAPMLGAATPRLAVNVSRAGGMGFVAGSKPEEVDTMLAQARTLLSNSTSTIRATQSTLPIGVGFQLFNCSLDPLAEVIAKHVPAVAWLFAPKAEENYRSWSRKLRAVTNGKTKIWIQVGSVADAMRSHESADVLVLQGGDAGGHGLQKSASVISLVPEVLDMLHNAGRSDMPILAAGGIVEARGFAAALALGASGAVMGTRFLAAEESGIPAGWKRELLRTRDGGISTLRSTLSDRLKGTKGWPPQYDGRAIGNKGHVDEESGMSEAENVKLYKEELKQGEDAWGPHGRMIAYAGTGVGLIKRVEPAETIVHEILSGTRNAVECASAAVGDDIVQSRL